MCRYGECKKGEIMSDNAIMVSVVMTAYNHEAYILKALDGVAKQITDFKVQIIVHDDASPDHTADLIRSYVAEHPDLQIETILQKENQFSKKIHFFDQFIYPLVRGKYIISCECDDYWIDEYKLQKQVDFLELHPEFIGVGHNCIFVDEHNNAIKPVYKIYGPYKNHICTLSTLAHGFYPGQTATLLYRQKEYFDARNKHLEDWYSIKCQGDKKKALELLLNGNIYFMSDYMSAYRVVLDKGTSWSARQYGRNRCFDQFIESIDCRKYTKVVYKQHFENYHVTLSCILKSWQRKKSGKKEDYDCYNQIVGYCGGPIRLFFYSSYLAFVGLSGYIRGKVEFKHIFSKMEP